MVIGCLFAFSLWAMFICALLLTDYWRLFPFWTGWCALTSWQAVALVAWADPMDTHFWLNEWAPIEKATLIMAALSVGEAVRHRSRRLPALDRFWLRFGLAVMPFSTVFYFARVQHGKPFAEFLQWREYVWMWLALTMFTCWLFFFWRGGRSTRLVRWHCGIFLILLLSHVVAAPQLHHGNFMVSMDSRWLLSPIWKNWLTIFRAITVVCCGLWTRNICRLFPGAVVLPVDQVLPENQPASLPVNALFDQSRLGCVQSPLRSEVGQSPAAQA